MKVLLTGASGFLSQYLLIEGEARGNSFVTVGRTDESMVKCDLSTNVPVISDDINIVIHAAGKAHSGTKNKGGIGCCFYCKCHGHCQSDQCTG